MEEEQIEAEDVGMSKVVSLPVHKNVSGKSPLPF